jgi:hypothetical protein
MMDEKWSSGFLLSNAGERGLGNGEQATELMNDGKGTKQGSYGSLWELGKASLTNFYG